MKAHGCAVFGAIVSIVALAACNGGGSIPSVGGSNVRSTVSNLSRSNENGFRSDGSLCKNYMLKLVNKTHLVEDKDVYFVLEGRDEKTDKFIYLANADGKTEDAVHGQDIKNFNLATTPEFKLPNMVAARFYVSYNKPLVFPVNKEGHIIKPDPINKNDPNYGTPWDFLEWNKFDCNGSINAFAPNTSAVDDFTIPMQFHVVGIDDKGKDADLTRGTIPHGYSTILQEIQSNPAFAKLALSGGSGRILSPIKGYDANLIDRSYYDGYIGEVWKKYEKAKLKMTFNLLCDGGVTIEPNGLEGQVQNGQLVFTQTPGQCKQLKPIAFSMPNTKDVFFGLIQQRCVSGCGGAEADVMFQIAAALNAAFNRSTLLKTTTISNRTLGDKKAWPRSDADYCEQKDWSFYDVPKDGVTNFYSKYIHEQSVENLSFALSNDELCGQSSIVDFTVPGAFDGPPFTVTLVER